MTLRFEKGNLLHASADALVNTVNEVGVMGKGIALMFRDAFPGSAQEYQAAARAGRVKVGSVLVTENDTLPGPRWIIHFPTKRHWRQPTRIEWVREGLGDLARVVRELGIASIAIPPLGCGNGGLAWSDVRNEIEMVFGDARDVDVVVYEPTIAYMGVTKKAGVERLTPARALVSDLIRRYEAVGFECTLLEVQKLAWFLTREIRRLRLPDPLRLHFEANIYGPYDDRLRHLLDSLDGSYLHASKRLGDAGPYDHVRFDYGRRAELDSYLQRGKAQRYIPALESAAQLIEGFESPLGMELLATVDWVLWHSKGEPTIESITTALKHWPGGKKAVQRKLALFNGRLLSLALARLTAPRYEPEQHGLFARAAS